MRRLISCATCFFQRRSKRWYRGTTPANEKLWWIFFLLFYFLIVHRFFFRSLSDGLFIRFSVSFVFLLVQIARTAVFLCLHFVAYIKDRERTKEWNLLFHSSHDLEYIEWNENEFLKHLICLANCTCVVCCVCCVFIYNTNVYTVEFFFCSLGSCREWERAKRNAKRFCDIITLCVWIDFSLVVSRKNNNEKCLKDWTNKRTNEPRSERGIKI